MTGQQGCVSKEGKGLTKYDNEEIQVKFSRGEEWILTPWVSKEETNQQTFTICYNFSSPLIGKWQNTKQHSFFWWHRVLLSQYRQGKQTFMYIVCLISWQIFSSIKNQLALEHTVCKSNFQCLSKSKGYKTVQSTWSNLG